MQRKKPSLLLLIFPFPKVHRPFIQSFPVTNGIYK
uniref:Uncharacterized protein n=1 Tax=Rhizophora mucronata TaxID=61149 RepID=A0A2P2J0W2_RHIMU